MKLNQVYDSEILSNEKMVQFNLRIIFLFYNGVFPKFKYAYAGCMTEQKRSFDQVRISQ